MPFYYFPGAPAESTRHIAERRDLQQRTLDAAQDLLRQCTAHAPMLTSTSLGDPFATATTPVNSTHATAVVTDTATGATAAAEGPAVVTDTATGATAAAEGAGAGAGADATVATDGSGAGAGGASCAYQARLSYILTPLPFYLTCFVCPMFCMVLNI